MKKIFVILTHDVDWSKKGPGIRHILARRDRFTEDVIEKVIRNNYNPYYNIPEIMDIEEKHGVRSTFFFRPLYDDGLSISAYEDDIKTLIKGGWEIAAHLNSVKTLKEIKSEKETIENIAKISIKGCRVHYLKINISDYEKIRKAGFIYDSSLKNSKARIVIEDMNYKIIHNVIIFPITIMDAYLFTYMKVSESNIVNVIERTINLAINNNMKVVTILWHVASLKMRGGRAYPEIVEYLSSRDDVSLVRAIDIVKIIKEGII